MQSKIVFREMLSELKALADVQGNYLTKEDIKKLGTVWTGLRIPCQPEDQSGRVRTGQKDTGNRTEDSEGACRESVCFES